MTETTSESAQTATVKSAYSSYVLGVFTLVYCFNYLDRQILAILAEPIKRDLGLQDWQLGFLTGTSFALFYATMGLPIARLADRYNRVNILSIALVVWSSMTALCGVAGNFVQLAAARIMVGVGEAGGSPPAVSILSDYYPEERRATALGIYNLGVPLGTLLGFVVGGWVNELYGWRIAFLTVGIPGILLAIVVKLTIREPERVARTDAAPKHVSLWSAIKVLYANDLYRTTIIATMLYAITVNVFFLWTPANMIRLFGLGTGQVGTIVGIMAGLGGVIGSLGGGYLADRLSKRNRRWLLWIPALSMLAFFPLVTLGVLMADWRAYSLLLAPAFILAIAVNASVWTVTQNAVSPEMRATSAAFMLFAVNLIGLGLGPQLAGLVSDLVQPSFGNRSLQVAIPLVTSFAWIAAYYYFKAAKHIEIQKDKPEGVSL